MSVMVSVEFLLQAGKQKEFLEILGNVFIGTRAYDGCIKVETYAEDNGASIIPIEEWDTKEHQQTYFQWRVDTGMSPRKGHLFRPRQKSNIAKYVLNKFLCLARKRNQ